MRYDIIAFSLISIIAVLSIVYNFILFGKTRKLLASVITLHVERSALEDLVASQAINKEEAIDQNDGFVKFLSDSREWAFNYIDGVQETIFVLKEKYENKKALDETLQKLFSMLPENNKEK